MLERGGARWSMGAPPRWRWASAHSHAVLHRKKIRLWRHSRGSPGYPHEGGGKGVPPFPLSGDGDYRPQEARLAPLFFSFVVLYGGTRRPLGAPPSWRWARVGRVVRIRSSGSPASGTGSCWTMPSPGSGEGSNFWWQKNAAGWTRPG